MRAARPNLLESLKAAPLPVMKTVVNPSAAQANFRSQWQNELGTPEAMANAAARQAAAKKKAGAATADAAAQARAKSKQTFKPGDEQDPSTDVKTTEAGFIAATMPTGVVPGGGPTAVEAKSQTKKTPDDAAQGQVNGVPSAVQQMTQAEVDASGQVEAAGMKQAELGLAVEAKTKHGSGVELVGLSAKPTAVVLSADGLAVGGGGVAAMGGVGGQMLQSGHSSGSSSRDEAQSMRAAHASVGTPQLIASSPTQLDVGVLDGTHGWLQIRAELSAGGAVNASLTSGDAAHESLRTALPEMTHYLGSEAVNVSSIELHKFNGGFGGMPEGQQNGDAAGQHSSDTAGQHSGSDESQLHAAAQSVIAAPGENVPLKEEGAASSAANGVQAEATSATANAPEADLTGSQMLPWQVGYAGSGGWVNVSA